MELQLMLADVGATASQLPIGQCFALLGQNLAAICFSNKCLCDTQQYKIMQHIKLFKIFFHTSDSLIIE
jgi:hypothetical protein